MEVTRERLVGLEMALDRWNDGGPAAQFAALLHDLIDQAEAAPSVPDGGPDWPEYSKQGMGCGLEDCGITDRYEAMQHGWEDAVDRCAEAFNNWLHTQNPVPVGSYGPDPLACQGCVAGCFRCTPDAVTQHDRNSTGLVTALETIKAALRVDDPNDQYEMVCNALSAYRAADKEAK